jgi:DNA ligase 1
MTEKYPDLTALVPHICAPNTKTFILEGEIVAVDDTGNPKPFQTLAGRAKKAVPLSQVKVQVCLFAFDLMYLNGESLLLRPLRERRGLLRRAFVEVPLRFTWVKSMDGSSKDQDELLAFFKGAVDAKCEGIMVKVLDEMTTEELEAAEKFKAEGKTSRRKGFPATYGDSPAPLLPPQIPSPVPG